MPGINLSISMTVGYLRPRRAAIFRRMYPFASGPGSIPRPWVRYALIAEVTIGTQTQYRVIGYRWTGRGARRAVDALGRAR